MRKVRSEPSEQTKAVDRGHPPIALEHVRTLDLDHTDGLARQFLSGFGIGAAAVKLDSRADAARSWQAATGNGIGLTAPDARLAVQGYFLERGYQRTFEFSPHAGENFIGLRAGQARPVSAVLDQGGKNI